MGIYYYSYLSMVCILILCHCQLSIAASPAHGISPDFFTFDRIFPQPQRRRHRSHWSNIRLDRFQRLIQTKPFTIFVLGANRRSVPVRKSQWYNLVLAYSVFTSCSWQNNCQHCYGNTCSTRQYPLVLPGHPYVANYRSNFSYTQGIRNDGIT